MTVGINIQANVTGSAASGVRTITKSLVDLQKALRAVGGDMSKLSEQDRTLWNELNKNVEAGLKTPLGERLVRRIQRTNGKISPGSAAQSILNTRLSIDPAEDARQKRNIINAFGGSAVVPGGSQEGGGAGGGSGGAMAFGRMAMKRVLLPVAALMGVGSLLGTAKRGLDDAGDLNTDTGNLQRRTGALNESLDRLISRSRAASDGLQLTYRETTHLADAFARASRETDSRSVFGGARDAAAFARSYGLDPDRTAQVFGSLRSTGAGGAGAGGMRQMSFFVAEAIQRSGLVTRSGEVLETFQRFAERFTTQNLRGPGSAMADFGGLFTGLNEYARKNNMPGLLNGGSEDLIGKINDALSRGGAYGEASQVFMMGALHAGSPFRMRYMQEGGMFERTGRGNETVLSAVMKRLNGMYGGPGTDAKPNYRYLDAGSNLLGVNMRQMQALAQSRLATKSFGGFGDFLKQSDVSMASLKGSAIQEMSQLYAGKLDGDIKPSLLAFNQRKDIDQTTKDRIGGLSGDAQAQALAKVLSERGRENNLAVQSQQATVDMKNALEAAMAKILPEVVSIKGGVVQIAKFFGYRPTGEESRQDIARRMDKDRFDSEQSYKDRHLWMRLLPFKDIPAAGLDSNSMINPRNAVNPKSFTGFNAPVPRSISAAAVEGNAIPLRFDLNVKLKDRDTGDEVGEVDQPDPLYGRPTPGGFVSR